MLDRFRHALLGRWSLLVSCHPWWVLFVATLLAVACIAVTAGRLSFQSNRNDLLSPGLDWNQRFIHWQTGFPGVFDLAVVVDVGLESVEPDYPDRYARAVTRMDRLAERVEALRLQGLVTRYRYRFGSEEFSPRAARLLPMDRFRAVVERASEAEPILRSPSLSDLLDPGKHPGRLAGANTGDSIRLFARVVDRMTALLRSPGDGSARIDLTSLAVDSDQARWQYIVSRNGRMLFMRVTPTAAADTVNAYEPTIHALRGVIGELAAERDGIDIGMTGIQVIEADETRVATSDGTRTSVIAFVLILAVLVLAFHSFRTPVSLMIALLFGIAWSFGFLTLAVGHLQVLSVVFTLMLLGLGVAYGVYIATRFERVRHDYPDTIEGFALAMRDTLETVGPGVFTGALTTAVAFMATLLTDFRGVAEMGLISGVGVMLCLAAMLSVFPALLRLLKPDHAHIASLEDRYLHFFEERWVRPFIARPTATLLVGLLLTAVSLLAVSRMHFDFDLMKLLPTGVESVTWQSRIMRDGGESVYQAASIIPAGDPAWQLEEGRRRAQAFRSRAGVSELGGYGWLFPADDPDKRAVLADKRAELQPLIDAVLDERPSAGGDGSSLPDRLTLIRTLLRLGGSDRGGSADAVPELAAALDRWTEALNSVSQPERPRRLALIQEQYRASRRDLAGKLGQLLDGHPLRPSDLPPDLLWPYQNTTRTADGQTRTEWVLEVAPRVPAGMNGPLDPRFLPGFIADVTSVDPLATGVVMQIYRSGSLIKSSYQTAGLIALGAVLLVVWFDFWNLRLALMSLVPVCVGFATCFGVMWCLGVQINPANIIVLPLMFGIGIDAGVHVLHRYRMDPATRPLGLTAGTGKGITVTSLTTVIGFGSMLLAHHRGIAGLGFVLALGVALTMLACWTIMPAWLEMVERARAGNRSSLNKPSV